MNAIESVMKDQYCQEIYSRVKSQRKIFKNNAELVFIIQTIYITTLSIK